MDPVDRAILWGHYVQGKVLAAADDILNAPVVADTTDFLARTGESMLAQARDKLPFGSSGTSNDVAKLAPKHAPSGFEKYEAFVRDHKKLAAFILSGAVSGAALYRYYHRRNHAHESLITVRNNKKYIRTDKRRRARRLPNGARNSVVVIVGSPLEPLVRIVANDLEKRGFIVYVTVLNDRELQYVRSENSEDIRALRLDVDSEEGLAAQVEAFDRAVNCPVVPFPQAAPHHLKLVGVLFVPDLYYPVGPVENIGARGWSDCVHAKVLSPLVLFSSRFLTVIRNNNALQFGDRRLDAAATKLVLVTPSLTAAINMPFHAPETVAVTALTAVFAAFAREATADPSLNVQVAHLKVGALNIFNHSDSRESAEKFRGALNHEVFGWDDSMKSIYGAAFKRVCLLSGPSPSIRGANLRELNYRIFDILYEDAHYKKRVTYKRDMKVYYVGRGARLYDLIGTYLPSWLVSWAIGCNSLTNIFFRLLGY